MEQDIDEILGRGVVGFIDPQGAFKDKLIKKARGEYKPDIVIKFGVDPTRPDIHIGHAVVFRKLRQFQELGCKVIFLVGDYTAQIGDPTGNSKTRAEVDQQEVEKNMKTFLDQVGKILRTEPEVFSWIRNSEWFVGVNDVSADPNLVKIEMDGKPAEISGKPVDPNSFIGKAIIYENTRMQKTHLHRLTIAASSLTRFLSVLRHITHSRLIARDMFQDRIKNGEELFMHEMMYPVLQGIDSALIAQIYGSCDMEIGGSDQTFNMLVGRDVMKMTGLPEQAVMSLEILPGLDGAEKMSKSLDNYIAITDTPADMFGKAMSIPDSAIITYFNLCTPVSDVESYKKRLESNKENPRDIKMELARLIVAMYHGEKVAELAEKDFVETFSNRGLPQDIPTVKVVEGAKIIEPIISEGVVESKTEWRRLVEDGAVTDAETGEKITDPDQTIKKPTVFKVGKRRFIRIDIL